MAVSRKKPFVFVALALGLILISSFLFAVLSLGHLGISMDAKGKMTMEDCPFMPNMSICPMTLLAHVSSWQNMFLASVSEAQNRALLILFVLVLGTVAVLKRGLFLLLNLHATRWRLYIRSNQYLLPLHFLREILSQGILNSKAH